jgi:hypothetical protein
MMRTSDRPIARAPHQADVHRHRRDAHAQDDVARADAEQADQREGQQEPRKREHDVDPALDQRVRAAAVESGRDAERNADRRAEADREHADQQRDAAAVDDPRQDVAPELVGAERMRRARRLQHGVEIGGVGAVGQQRPREQRREPHDGQHREAGHGGAVARQPCQHRQRVAEPTLPRRTSRIGYGDRCSHTTGPRAD